MTITGAKNGADVIIHSSFCDPCKKKTNSRHSISFQFKSAYKKTTWKLNSIGATLLLWFTIIESLIFIYMPFESPESCLVSRNGYLWQEITGKNIAAFIQNTIRRIISLNDCAAGRLKRHLRLHEQLIGSKNLAGRRDHRWFNERINMLPEWLISLVWKLN